VVPQSVKEYTLGGTATIIQDEHWTHSIVAGFDGSRLTNLADYHTPLPSASGPDLGLAGGNANLGTLRVSSVAKLGDPDNLAATLTFAGENSLLDFRSQPETTSTLLGVVGGTGDPVAKVVRRWTSAGVAQANVSWRDAAYITSGLRVERNDALGSNRTVSVLPMIGAALLRDYGPLTVKLRSAYGSGIRPATTPIRETAWFDPRGQARLLNLAPEEQAGIETGLDIYLGKTFGVQVTRFDQLASGLIQRVGYAMYQHSQASSQGGGGYPAPVAAEDRHIAYVLQNVGEITNRGWELKGDLNIAALTLGGTFSTVDSRVRKVAEGYVGDLRVGDRMPEVPARTGSVSAAWIGKGWTSSLAASRSWDWIDYDRIALAGAFSNSSQSDAQLVGQELRNFWLKYGGVTRLRASVGRSLYRGLSFTLSGENLLNRQHGEPDNVTVVPGRTISVGLRARM
jgi:iron complex outermembrane receptor protein